MAHWKEVQFEKGAESEMLRVSWEKAPMSANLFIPDDSPDAEVERVTVSLPREQYEQVLFVAALYAAFDRRQGRERAKKWKPSQVLAYFTRAMLVGIGDAMGGFPGTAEARAKALKEAGTLYEKLRKP